MDKFLIRKDVYDELIEKGYGKKDYSRLQKVPVVDKNGHTRMVYKKNGEEPNEARQPKAQDAISPERKARYDVTKHENNKSDKAENKSVPGSEEALDKAWKFLKSKYIHDIVRGPFKSIQIKAGSSDRAKELGKELEADYNYKLYGVYDRRYVYIPTNRDTLFPDETPEETAKIKIF